MSAVLRGIALKMINLPKAREKSDLVRHALLSPDSRRSRETLKKKKKRLKTVNMSLRSPARPFSFAVRGSEIYAAGAKLRKKREREIERKKETVGRSCLDGAPRLKHRT